MLTRRIMPCTGIFLALMLAGCATATAEQGTRLRTDGTGSAGHSAGTGRLYTQEELDRVIDDLMEMAGEEMELTAEEAVKAAVTEAGAELAAQKARADGYAEMCGRLEEENAVLAAESGRLRRQGLGSVLAGTAAGAGAGAVIASLVFLLLGAR